MINTEKLSSLKKILLDVSRLKASLQKHKKRHGDEFISAEIVESALVKINKELSNDWSERSKKINGGLSVL